MNNTTFIEYTEKYNNFAITYEEAKSYLIKLLSDEKFSNINNIHQINFEKLIAIDYNYGQIDDVMKTLLNEVKKKITGNYIYKMKLLNRLELKDPSKREN